MSFSRKVVIMLVKNWMSRPVVTVPPTASMQMARDLMDRHGIGALPVVRDDKLVGLLTDRNLKRAEASDATTLATYELSYILQKVAVSQIMQSNPVTIEFDRTLSEAAELFLAHDLEAVPVMAAQDQLMGVLTRSDLSRAFLKLTAFGRRGVQFGIRLPDAPGAVMEIIAAVRNAGARLASLITTDSQSGEDMREAYVHIYQVNRDTLTDLVGDLRRKGTVLYLVDLKTNERHIYDR
jgi:acetoin utilization protein AcuB